MAERTLNMDVAVNVKQKDIGDIATLEKRLKALQEVYKVYVEMVEQGIDVDKAAYNIKELERTIQSLNRVIGEARKVMGDNSFNDAFKRYNKNLEAQYKNMELYKGLNDKQTQEAKNLLESAKAAARDNATIRNSMSGVFDFKEYTSAWIRDKRISTDRKEVLSAGKEQLSAEKQAAKDAASTWSALYKERESITKGLGKLSEASKKYATDAKNRLEAINSEMSGIANKWSGNEVFDNTIASVENKAASANIISRLSELHSNEQKSAATRMSEIRNELIKLNLEYLKSGKDVDQYEEKVEKLREEYNLLENAVKNTNHMLGKGGFAKFGASIKGHLYWMISGQLVDQLQMLPMMIQDITVEFDKLKRKIEQNIEMTDEFANDTEKLEHATNRLVERAFDLANVYGMKAEEALDMMQIMSRRFKNPDELVYYTNLAMTMSKLDFVTPAVAAETLEAVVLSFGLTAKESADFLDQFTVATHTMRVNGEDLLQSLQRSAPMLKAWGMTTAEAVAIISSLSTTLGREGTYIGTALNGMFSRPLKPENIKALESVGIHFNKANGEAKTGIEIIREYHERFKTLSESAQREEVNKIFGTNRFAPAMSVLQNWDLIEETLDKIEGKSSRLNTFKVLQVQMNSLESQMNRIGNAFKMVGYALGEELMPPFTSCIEFIARLVSRLIRLHGWFTNVLTSIISIIPYMVAFKVALQLVNARMGKNVTLLQIITNGFGSFGKSTNSASIGIRRFSIELAAAAGRFARTTFFIWALVEAMNAIGSYLYKKYEDYETEKHIRNLKESGKWDKNSYTAAAYNERQRLDRYLSNNKGRYEELQARATEAGDMNIFSTEEARFMKYYEGVEEQRKKADHDLQNAIVMDEANEDAKKWEKVHGNIASITHTPPGTEDSFVNKDNESEEDKKFDKGTKMVLDAKTSKYKTDEEIAKKRFDSAIKDVDYEEELLGKTPRTIMDRMHLRANRKKELLDQYALINADIDALNDKLDKLKGKGDNDEAINDKGETTTTAKLRATYSKALDELRKLAVENEETRKEIKRSIRKSYEVAYDKQIEEEKKRNETTKKLTLLSIDNKRNAWNDTTKNNVELEHERKNNAILVKDYEKTFKDREELEYRLFLLRQNSATEIARIGEERYKEKVKTMERELQEARDLEAEKLLLKEESNKKIEELEYKQTQKIREGLHGVVQELLLEGKSWKDIWKQLWTDLAEEALRALMRIEGGQQSTLGALAATLGGLDGGSGKGGRGAKAAASTAGYWADLGAPSSASAGKGKKTSHDGSIVGVTPLPTRYYHNGGNVGTSVVPYLKSDEVNAVLQTGEEVVSRKDRRSNELMSEQNKHMADAMQRMAEGSNTNVTFAIQAIDSKSIVQLLNENGDAIMNILRKQSAYGNGRI